jgi:CO dehydrogenase/acetyl-CoA synthase gamma subunit (corrinoid Fe-S protein)
MALTGTDIYKNILPKTNCGDCCIVSCFTFAATVAANKVPLSNFPHIQPVGVQGWTAKLAQ